MKLLFQIHQHSPETRGLGASLPLNYPQVKQKVKGALKLRNWTRKKAKNSWLIL
ncbi:hypothetical protein ACOSP7_010588 [Xanthoceras sorbifolium]